MNLIFKNLTNYIITEIIMKYISLSYRYATRNATYRSWWSTNGASWYERPTSRFDARRPTSSVLGTGLLKDIS